MQKIEKMKRFLCHIFKNGKCENKNCKVKAVEKNIINSEGRHCASVFLQKESGFKIMPNIVLTRIDNRLIHGQVATQWCGSVGANLLLVANDAVSTDKLRQGLMNMAAPGYAQTRYFSIEKTIQIIGKASPRQMIAIICENPQDVLRLVEGGVPIKKVNIGNMHMSEGKRQVATSVAVDDADVEAFRKLQELGVELEIRRVPDIAAEDTSKLFAK